MRSKISLWFLLVTCCLSTNVFSVESNYGYLRSNKSIGAITAGAGYSTDMHQIDPSNCFNMVETSVIPGPGDIEITAASSLDTLEKILKIYVSVAGGYGMFAGNDEASYLRRVKEKRYSLSLHYYQYQSETVGLDVNVSGDDIQPLNDRGKFFYQDGNNPLFGITCGDHVLSSYDRGAMLLMSLNLVFDSKEELTDFKNYFGASYGSIIDVSADVAEYVKKNHIDVTIEMRALQNGGDSTQLAQILNKDPSGDYYMLTCGIKDLYNCTKAAEGIFDYADNNFRKQLNHTENFVPLGPGFTDHYLIDRLFLKVPPSLVDTEVQQCRKDLGEKYLENSYYAENSDAIMNSYPVPLDTSSAAYKNIAEINRVANSNLNILMDSNNGAVQCWTNPENCKDVYATLMPELQEITDFSGLEELKYYYRGPRTVGGAMADIYPTGTSWKNVNNPNAEDQIITLTPKCFSDAGVKFDLDTKSSGPGGDHRRWEWSFHNSTVINPDDDVIDLDYTRYEITNPWNNAADSNYLKKLVSPYYFGKYAQ